MIRRLRPVALVVAIAAAIVTLLPATPAIAADAWTGGGPGFAPDPYQCAGDPMYAGALWACQMHAVSLNYRGWARIRTDQPRSALVAYRWSTSGWSRTWRVDGDRIYVYPYAIGWVWTWSAQDGWLAMAAGSPTGPITAATGQWIFTLRAAAG